jgi:DNA-binding MarR family transcriptional regulator
MTVEVGARGTAGATTGPGADGDADPRTSGALAQESLSWNGFVVLRMIWSGERIETRQCAAQAGLAKGTLTGVVDRLVARDLVRRVAHPQDGRLMLLELTATGRRLMRRLLPAVHAEEGVALRGLNAEQCDSLAVMLRHIGDGLAGSPKGVAGHREADVSDQAG